MSNIKVKSYTPSWLSKPAPGHTLFKATSEDLDASVFSPYSSNKKARPGPRRTIARRGTEVFVAVNREIRWGDLVYLKESWVEMGASTRIKREDSNGSFSIYDETRNDSEGSEDRPAEGYRVSWSEQISLGNWRLPATEPRADSAGRLSRLLWPMRSDKSSSLRTRTTWQL